MAKIIIGAAMIAGAIIGEIFLPAGAAYWMALASAGASMLVAGIAQKVTGHHSQGVGTAFRQAAAPWNVLYGRGRLGGVFIFASNNGWRDFNMDLIVAMTGHICFGPQTPGLYLDGKLVNGPVTLKNPNGGTMQSDENIYYDWGGNPYQFGKNGRYFVSWAWLNGNVDQNPAGLGAYSELAADGGNGNWTNKCQLLGRATMWLRLRYDQETSQANSQAFPNGVPSVRSDWVGKCDLYDPRTGARGYTENWALIVSDYLCNEDFGLGCDYSTEIDEEQLIAAANICDEPVAILAGGYEPRYAINGTFTVDSTPGDVLNNLMTAAAGRLTVVGGTWKIFPGVWQGVGMELGDNDLYSPTPIKWIPRRKWRDLLNAVKGTFVCPTYPYISAGPGLPLQTQGNYINASGLQQDIFDGQWQPTDFPAFARASYLCDDAGFPGTNDRGQWIIGTHYAVNDAVMCLNEPYICIANNTASDANEPSQGTSWMTYWQHVPQQRLWMDLRLPFTISAAASQRIAKIYLMRNRQQGTGTLKCKLTALQMQALDVIQWTHGNFGFSNKLLEISSFRINFQTESETGTKNSDGPLAYCEIDIQESDPSVYAWSITEEQVPNGPSPQQQTGAGYYNTGPGGNGGGEQLQANGT